MTLGGFNPKQRLAMAAYFLSLLTVNNGGITQAAACAFFERAFGLQETPEKNVFDKCGFNAVAVVSIQADSDLTIVLHQS